jgi:hypothetical protein
MNDSVILYRQRPYLHTRSTLVVPQSVATTTGEPIHTLD